MIIETKKLLDLKPAPYNPRCSTKKQEKHLQESLRKFGVVEPIIFNKQTGYIVGGHFRVRELKKLGYKEVECVIVDLNEADEKELNIRLNANTGDWDFDTLANEWNVEELAEWGLDIPNFEIDEVLEAEEDDFDVPEGGIETDIVLGDLFEIGNHRLLCGDSTDSDSVAKLMNGEKADMAHNDPPYGMKKEKDGVLNDNLNYDDLLDFNREWIALQFMHLKENGSWYCWGIDEPLMDIYSNILKPYIKEQKATFRNLITWDKGNGQGQLSEEFRMYPIADEKCLFVMSGQQELSGTQEKWTGKFDWLLDYLTEECAKVGLKKGQQYEKFMGSTNKSQHHLSKSHFGLMQEEDYKKLQEYAKEKGVKAFKREYDELKKEYYSTRAYFNNVHDNMNNVWHFDRHIRQGDEGGHATPKPIPLCERAIKSSCPDNGLVLDFFLGSGSTMVAAHQLKRKCYGMELDPKYCQVIVDRMRKLDPNLVIKKNGVEI